MTDAFEGWAIVELMGHRRLAGFVRDVELFGGRRLRIDVPKSGEPLGSTEWIATQFYGTAALYCVTPTDEATARRVAALSQPEPVKHWELPAPVRDVKCTECGYVAPESIAEKHGWTRLMLGGWRCPEHKPSDVTTPEPDEACNACGQAVLDSAELDDDGLCEDCREDDGTLPTVHCNFGDCLGTIIAEEAASNGWSYRKQDDTWWCDAHAACARTEPIEPAF